MLNQSLFIMDLKKIKQIINFVVESGVNEVELEQDGFKIRVTGANNSTNVVYTNSAPVHHAPAPQQVVSVSSAQSSTEATQSETKPIAAGQAITSPIVGTYYGSSSPDEPAYIKVGDRVEIGQTLCIIEAMKIMNEIESDKAGVVKEILVSNSQPVEFDQPLFIIG